MAKINKWWVIVKEDNTSSFGYCIATNKKVWFDNDITAIYEKQKLQRLRKEKLYVAERTCKVIK